MRSFFSGSSLSKKESGLDLLRLLEEVSGMRVSGCLVGSNVGAREPGGRWKGFGNPGSIMPGGKKGGIPGGRRRFACEVVTKGFRTRLAKGEAKLVGRKGDVGVAGTLEAVEETGEAEETRGESGLEEEDLVGVMAAGTVGRTTSG